jgi:hypothetical protein
MMMRVKICQRVRASASPASIWERWMDSMPARKISVEELSGTAYNIQAQTFENFEVYIVVGLIYLGLAIVLKVALAVIGRLFFGQDRGGGTLVGVAGKGAP